MKKFSQFGIKVVNRPFSGDKIKIDKVINREVTVEAYKIEKSKFDNGNGNRLCLQIKRNEEQYIIFTGSGNLMQQIQQVPEDGFPFETTIIKENEMFLFT